MTGTNELIIMDLVGRPGGDQGKKDSLFFITIVIPTYNSMSENKNIDRLLRSLFNQTYRNFEVIVVDNFSEDETKEVCSRYPVTFIEERSTISKAWNTGIDHAKGRFLLFIDSDMELPPSFLEDCVKVLESESVDCLRFESTYVESRKPPFINIVRARNWERESGGAPLNIYFYSADIIEDTRYPESENQLVGEEYIFRAKILEKNPKIGIVETRVLHYYDPSLAWVARRSWKYGKWFLETRKHLTSTEQLGFIRYNSVIKQESLPLLKRLFQKEPEAALPFFLYVLVKYVSFALGCLSSL